MKRFWIISLCLLMIIFNSCIGKPAARVTLGTTAGTAAKTTEPEIPRREFLSVESGVYPENEPSITGNFTAENIVFSHGAVNFSTALFLSDIGILSDVSKELFENYADVFFSQFPVIGEVKEIVIPGLSSVQNDNEEHDAYFFITMNDNNGHNYYTIESNIPISGIYARTYDGYVMDRDRGFFKNEIPARWTSIMNIKTSGSILLYNGIAYPEKSAPLIFTGTGIGSDIGMKAVLSDQSSVSEMAVNLESIVKQAIGNSSPSNQRQAESMKFLEKTTYLSMSAYFYIDSNFKESRKYFLLSKQAGATVPDDKMGSRHKELELIMDYLLNRI